MSRAFAYHQTHFHFRHAASTVSDRKCVQQEDLHPFMYPLFLPPSRVVDQTRVHIAVLQSSTAYTRQETLALAAASPLTARGSHKYLPRQSLSDSSTVAPVPVNFP